MSEKYTNITLNTYDKWLDLWHDQLSLYKRLFKVNWNVTLFSFNYAAGYRHTFKEWSKIPHCIIAWKHNKDTWNDWMSPLINHPVLRNHSWPREDDKSGEDCSVSPARPRPLFTGAQLVRNENDDTHNSYHAWKCHLETLNSLTRQDKHVKWHLIRVIVTDNLIRESCVTHGWPCLYWEVTHVSHVSASRTCWQDTCHLSNNTELHLLSA